MIRPNQSFRLKNHKMRSEDRPSPKVTRKHKKNRTQSTEKESPPSEPSKITTKNLILNTTHKKNRRLWLLKRSPNKEQLRKKIKNPLHVWLIKSSGETPPKRNLTLTESLVMPSTSPLNSASMETKTKSNKKKSRIKTKWLKSSNLLLRPQSKQKNSFLRKQTDHSTKFNSWKNNSWKSKKWELQRLKRIYKKSLPRQ